MKVLLSESFCALKVTVVSLTSIFMQPPVICVVCSSVNNSLHFLSPGPHLHILIAWPCDKVCNLHSQETFQHCNSSYSFRTTALRAAQLSQSAPAGLWGAWLQQECLAEGHRKHWYWWIDDWDELLSLVWSLHLCHDICSGCWARFCCPFQLRSWKSFLTGVKRSCIHLMQLYASTPHPQAKPGKLRPEIEVFKSPERSEEMEADPFLIACLWCDSRFSISVWTLRTRPHLWS